MTTTVLCPPISAGILRCTEPVPYFVTADGLAALAAAEDEPDLRAVPQPTAFTNGQRVKYVGMFGETDGPTGRVVRQYKSGVRVRWDSGAVDTVHPEDVRAVSGRP
ncbi:hypothetical protein [Mycobacteroides abscessus]|uniref:hypothetical protein n=1 Tax=Mycobacteroides abscessus TaxID=36809 RepID=UPI001878B899|nr:hypothetical protein [Mycobacteroides abscessus]